jgi:hypothetical protein
MHAVVCRLLQARYQLPLTLLGWGWWLVALHPFDTLPIYGQMARYGSEQQWGGGFAVVGLLATLAVIAADARPDARRAWAGQVVGAIAVTTSWLFVWLLIVMTDWRTTGSYIYGAMFAASLLNFFNIVIYSGQPNGNC